MSSPASGLLFVVATPIGNLADLSPRALETLRKVDAICAEDTRHTRQLLQHFGCETPLLALHEHNEDAQTDGLIQRLLAGQHLALVSDAGTPLISDPGFRLVRAARQAGIRVSPIPGPSALIAALSAAGLPSDRFCFEGFLPAKASARREHLRDLANETRTLIFYESAHRIEESLQDCVAVFGADRHAVLAREISKLFETIVDASLSELHALVTADANQRKGEFVLIIHGASESADKALIEGKKLYARLCEHMKPSQAAKIAADISGAPRKALYAAEKNVADQNGTDQDSAD
jgi:16S rRNA (cytidine1402-2'-O)-methyltransferase